MSTLLKCYTLGCFMIINTVVNLFGAFIFFFIFWKKNKEDYTSQQLFSSAFLILIILFLNILLAHYYFENWWFWLAFLGVALGFLVSYFRFRLRFYETLDSLSISLLPWLGLIFLNDSIRNYSASSLVTFLIISVFVALYLYLGNRYKNFTWYQSGKVGFAGISVTGMFFVIRGMIAIIYPSMLSFVGMYDAVLSGVLAFVFFLILYNLSRSL